MRVTLSSRQAAYIININIIMLWIFISLEHWIFTEIAHSSIRTPSYAVNVSWIGGWETQKWMRKNGRVNPGEMKQTRTGIRSPFHAWNSIFNQDAISMLLANLCPSKISDILAKRCYQSTLLHNDLEPM